MRDSIIAKHSTELDENEFGWCKIDNSEDMKILDMHEAFAKNYGYNQKKIIGKSFKDIVPEHDATSIRDIICDRTYDDESAVNINIIDKKGMSHSTTVHVNVSDDYTVLRVFDMARIMALNKVYYRVMRMFPCGFVTYIIKKRDDGKDEFFFEFANDKFYEIIGYTPEQFKEMGYKLFNILGGKNRDSAVVAYKHAMLVPDRSFQSEHSIYTFDGQEVYVDSYISRVKAKGVDYLICTFADISQRNLLEEGLRYLADRNRIIMNIAEEIIFEYDVNHDIFEISNKYENMFNISPFKANFFKSGSITELIHPGDKERIAEGIKSLNDKNFGGITEVRLCMKNGEYCWFQMVYAGVCKVGEEEVSRVVGRLTNIDKDKRDSERMKENLLLDQMTGLYNKTSIKKITEEFFSDPRAQEKIHAFIVIDIDNFKHVNDTLGHMIGDVVIENIAGAIKTVIRAEDLAGRVGGDEFVVILKNISERWAASKAESINEAISCIYIGENQNYKISASIGISFFGPDGHDYDTLFKKADTAMYYSKKGGKNKVTLFNSGSHEVIGSSYDEQDDVDSIIQKEYDKGFLQYTYTLFLNSKSFDSTLNILLERVGKKYNLSTVSIMENTTNDKIYYETNKWERGQGIVTRGLHIDEKVYLKALENFKANEMNVIEDCLDSEKICESDREFFKKHEFRGYASTLIDNQELHNGIVFFFIDRNNPLRLSDYDKETLYQFCLTVTLFITMHSNTLRNAHELEKLYTFDRLTGVNNLETFMIKGNEIIKNMDRFRYYALMYSDIVGFSHVNESLGFDYGDEILINYATIISGEPNVETVCRVHSDLFANIISADSRVEVLAAIERIRAKFYAYQEHYFPTAGCKINIGVYHIEDVSQDMSYAFDCANLARKNARLSNSANITFYAEEMRLDRNMEQSITSGIHSAIANGDLMIYLQPKIDMRTGETVGAESLIRWTDKNGGVTLPDTFVPALEKQGSIVDVDFFAFEETLKTINKWKQEGKKDVRISVNFSRRHNSIPNFVDRIVSLTEKHHVEPSEVEIEVTESCLASDSDVMYRNLEKLHDMGYVISMDDFGTGYSSLEILLSSPVDIVKIDKSFLRKFDEGELNKEYIIKICELIRVTGKDIVFEGIENQNQIDFLLGNSCYYGQGFFFSKAIPVHEFEEKFLFK